MQLYYCVIFEIDMYHSKRRQMCHILLHTTIDTCDIFNTTSTFLNEYHNVYFKWLHTYYNWFELLS